MPPARALSFYDRGPSDRSSTTTTGSDGSRLSRAASATAPTLLGEQLVTVNDQAERILSIRTSTSGRRTFTHTDTGRVIVQPVFFSPGGLVSTNAVAVYEADEALTVAAVRHRSKRSSRKSKTIEIND
jgi:hypothetical protein